MFIVFVRVLITFWSKNFLSMGLNTGSQMPRVSSTCYAIIAYMLQNFLSRSKVSARTAGSHRQLNTDSIYTLYLRLGKKFPSCIETLPVYKQ